MTDFLMALFLGFVEGLAEFIPVSSTAHLIVLVEGLHFPAPPGHVFEVFIQIGAIMAVVVLYFKKLWHTALTLHREPASRRFAYNLLLGSVPALAVGALAHDWIKSALYNPQVIGTMLILGGIAILLLERRLEGLGKIGSVDAVPPVTAFKVGCFQMLALVPGVSRSGATIMGALALGLTRPAAAELSFFLAIPVMFAAVAYDTLKNWDGIASYGRYDIMLGGLAAAFVTALAVVKFAIGFISRYGFAPFAFYRIAAGVAILILFSWP